MRCTVTVVTVTMLLLAGAALAEAPEETTNTIEKIGGLSFRDEVELTVVEVIVYVTDADGEPVTDLEREDFRLYQDGELREITNFAVSTERAIRTAFRQRPSEPSAVPGDEAVEDEPDLRPAYVVLYIDNENLHPFDRNRVLDHARRFVKRNLHPPVEMMVVSADKRLHVEQEFTDNQKQVLQALDRQRMKTGGRRSRDDRHREIIGRMDEYRYDAGASMTNQPSNVYGLIMGEAKREANALTFSLAAQRAVISTLAGLPGKKALVYISNGLSTVPGVDMLHAYAKAYDQPSVMMDVGQLDQTRRFEQLIASANAQNVSYYTIDASGLKSAAVTSAESGMPTDTMAVSAGQLDEEATLRNLAEKTGGRALVGSNNFELGFRRIADDLYTYYSLGYALQTSGGDKVHRIRVEIPEHPECDVRYRRRFVEQSRETKVKNAVITNLMFPVDDNPMELEVELGEPAPASEDRWLVPIHVSFPLEKIALLPRDEDTYAGETVLFLAARSKGGGQSDLVRQEHTVTVPAERYDEVQEQRFGIDARLLMETGQYTVSVGLLDQVTRQASYARHEQVID